MTQSATGLHRDRERRSTCSFCGYPIPGDPVHLGSGDSAPFCSETCATSYERGDEPFVGRTSFRQFVTGVSVLDTLLPRGMPAGSFVLLSGEEGMRHRGLQTELVWRALGRGEPCVIISFVDASAAIVEEFLSFGWNVLPFLEDGRLHVIDCFTNRLREGHRSPARQTDWNAYLETFLDEPVTLVRDPTNLQEVETKLHDVVASLEMVGSGVTVVDSLNEVRTQGRELQTEQFIKEVRTDICSRLCVPIFASTTTTEEDDFTKNHAYVFDGIIDMRHNEEAVPDVRFKQIGIRKMDGVNYRSDWIAYENRGYRGFVPFDPRATPTSGSHPLPRHSRN